MSWAFPELSKFRVYHAAAIESLLDLVTVTLGPGLDTTVQRLSGALYFFFLIQVFVYSNKEMKAERSLRHQDLGSNQGTIFRALRSKVKWCLAGLVGKECDS